MRFYICDFDSSFGAERCGMVVKTGLASCAKRRVGQEIQAVLAAARLRKVG